MTHLATNQSLHMNTIIPDFFSAIDISQLTYCLETQGKMEIFSTNPDCMQISLKQQRHEVNEDNNIVNIRVSSQSILNQIESSTDEHTINTKFVLRHHRYVEHIYLTSENPLNDLNQLLLKDKSLKKKIIQYIRNFLQTEIAQTNIVTISCATCLSEPLHQPAQWHAEVRVEKNRFYIFGLKGICYLTYMEMECFLHHIRMMTHKEIANMLGISSKTIENHLANLKNKLGISVKSDLFKIAKNNDLI